MNIYLDIDGVLLANEKHLALHAEEFLNHILKYYPDTTYWLTTHCQGDTAIPMQRIGHLFKATTAELMQKIHSTRWHIAKTEAIDFTQPFLWFDDDLFPEERIALLKHGVLDSWIEVDLCKNRDQLKLIIQRLPFLMA